MTINNERLQLLQDALRSGDYKQGLAGLHPSEDTYCCLGVACDVYQQETGEGQWEGDTFFAKGEAHAGYLPSAVVEWYGFDSYNPMSPASLREKPFSRMNDYGNSFEEIADSMEDLKS